MTTVQHMGANYLSKTRDAKQFRKVVLEVSAIVRKLYKAGKIDYIACVGQSGALVTAPVSFHTGVPMVAIRKKGVSNHSGYDCEGLPWDTQERVFNYVIIDDLISSGATVAYAMATLQNAHKRFTEKNGSKCVGAVLYAHYGADVHLSSKESNSEKIADGWEWHGVAEQLNLKYKMNMNELT